MGCFNHTCAVSNLPITSNDEIVVFILVRNAWWSAGKPNESVIYANHYYEVFGFPFVAKYNDYGWVENEESSVFLDWTLKQIDSKLIERSVGANSVHDVPVVRGLKDVETLGEYLIEDRLQFKNPYFRSIPLDTDKPLSDTLPVSFMFVHKHVYDTLNASFTEKYYDYDTKKYLKWSMESYAQDLKDKVLNFVDETYKDLDNQSENEIIRETLKDLKSYRFMDIVRQKFPSAKSSITIIEDIPDIDKDELTHRLSELAAFDLCMDRLHKIYHPQRCGSQDGASVKQIKALTQAINSVIKEQNKE